LLSLTAHYVREMHQPWPMHSTPPAMVDASAMYQQFPFTHGMMGLYICSHDTLAVCPTLWKNFIWRTGVGGMGNGSGYQGSSPLDQELCWITDLAPDHHFHLFYIIGLSELDFSLLRAIVVINAIT